MSDSPDVTIRPSLNEIASLCKRAVRGSGMSWGIAEEAASSVRWLSARKLPGPELLARLLSRQLNANITSLSPETGQLPWVSSGNHVCPLLTAAALSDNAGGWQHSTDKRMEVLDLAAPLLTLPVIARVAARQAAWLQVSWDDVTISTDGQSVSVQGPLTTLAVEQASRFYCHEMHDRVTLEKTTQRKSVDKYSWEVLEACAHRTYAPATEESRRLGAGGAD